MSHLIHWSPLILFVLGFCLGMLARAGKGRYVETVHSRNIYNATKRNIITESEFPVGKVERIVYKRVYDNGAIKYKTKDIKI